MKLFSLLLSSETTQKLNQINENFNSLINKYVGDGLGAMFVVLGLIVVAIIATRAFAKK